MSAAALNGVAATRARLQAGAWGIWWADVSLPEPAPMSGRVALTFADVSAQGFVISGGVTEGTASYRIAGGRGGWGKVLPPKAYRDDAGVKLGNVVGDAAAECGEVLEGVPATRLGPHYARVAERASLTLNRLASRAWRVDFDGVTRFGAPSPGVYAGDASRTRVDPTGQIIELVTDTVGNLRPGVIVDGSAPATDVEYSISAKRMTIRVYAARTLANRRLEAQRLILEALLPSLRYQGMTEYRVVLQSGDLVDLQPAHLATGMPELEGVPVRWASGYKVEHLLGSLVLVSFIDGDPSRPCVIAGDSPDAPGWMPLTIDIGGPGGLGIVRQTDAVQAGPFGGIAVGGSLRVKCAL